MGLLVGCGAWAVVAISISFLPAGRWWTDLAVVIGVYVGLFLVIANITGKTKLGFLIAGTVVWMLVLNRVGWGNGYAFGVVLIALGLLSLIN